MANFATAGDNLRSCAITSKPALIQHALQCPQIYLFAVYDINSDSEIGTLTVTVEALEALLDLYKDE